MTVDLKILKQVLSLPTAPYHEQAVQKYIRNFCEALAIPYQEDSYGNIKVHYKKGRGRKVAFVAHMDHPGFKVIKGGKNPLVELLGGVPDKFFLRSKVVFCKGDLQIKGRVVKMQNKKKRRFFCVATEAVPEKSFGYLDFHGLVLKNGNIVSKACDNLVSVSILLNLLKVLKTNKKKADIVCLFTRAEEVGFVGAKQAVRSKFITTKQPVIVLEASSAKAGKVLIGGGPVLRVGDSVSVFSREVELNLRAVAEKLKKQDKKFFYQRALLAGGRCEAALFTAQGYQSGCLAFPLGNYHNRGLTKTAPEYISLADYKKMLTWLTQLV
ncbi:MAG: M28 family peptidase [Deltaproteobacteria bacterium]|nr:M28 family peptidase [Deltaproteobacteria bacterium]